MIKKIKQVFSKWEKEFEPTKWEDIEVGEVFGISGCFHIGYKQSKKSYKHIADDFFVNGEYSYCFYGPGNLRIYAPREGLYKLPRHIQNYWREE